MNTTDKGWEKEFDLRFRNRFFFATEINADSVKDFIRREIQQKGEEEYANGRRDGMNEQAVIERLNDPSKEQEAYDRGFRAAKENQA